MTYSNNKTKSTESKLPSLSYEINVSLDPESLMVNGVRVFLKYVKVAKSYNSTSELKVF